MNTSEMLLAAITSGLALLFAWRALRSQSLSADRVMKMAAIWVVIIVVLALASRAFVG